MAVTVKYLCGHEVDFPKPLRAIDVPCGLNGSCPVCDGQIEAKDLGGHFRISEPEYQEMITAAAQEALGG